MVHPRQDDVEWLDDDNGEAPRGEEELAAGTSRPPLRRRTRIALGTIAVIAVGAAVAVAATSADDRPATPTRTVTPTSDVAQTPAVRLPSRPPAAAVAAIRAAFPSADLTGFSAARAAGTERDVFMFYNATAGRRLITVTVGPPLPGQADAVLRTKTSFEIAQSLGRLRVDVLIRTESGVPSASDFAAVQRLVQDARLLATR